MRDLDIIEVEISQLIEEGRQLEQAHVGRPRSSEDEARLRSISVAVDQRWDLVRQRRARRSAGQNPDDATVRPAHVVEKYRQ